MNKYVFYEMCPRCGGDGVITRELLNGTHIDEPCDLCTTTGNKTIIQLQYKEGLFSTYQILEATNPVEYVALAPGNVALYNLIISAGTIDLSETTMALAVLRGMFAVGTTTRTNLEALIT